MELPGDHRLIAWLVAVGAVLGIGQLLVGGEEITWRLAVGRAIVSGGLGLAAGVVLAWMSVPLPALVGLACVLVSLGTSSLERVFQRFLGGPNGS